jgi:5-methylthioadenosine/S-adenosylhomocysteine deaminase
VSLNSEGEQLNSGSDRGGDRPVSGSGRTPGHHVTSTILLTGGCVLTLGAKTPNLALADVLIEDDVVAEVGRGLRARDAEQVDATDTIVMPGFVDTHRHAWTSLFRNLGERARSAEVPDSEALGDHFEPEDVYASTLIGLLGAAEAGITTVVDRSDLRSDDAFHDAALRAHRDAGLRTVFTAHHPALDREVLARLVDAAGPCTSIALGSMTPSDLDTVGDEWARARALGIRIHAHAGSESATRGVISEMAARRLLGPDVTLIHCSALDDADVDAIAASGASVSLAPSSGATSGLGSPPIQQLIDHDIRPGLGSDDERFGPGDMFAQMRATISMQHATVFDRKLAGKAGLPRLMGTRDVIRHATVDGARVAGLSGVTGSLEPGMQADVIMLRTDRPNVFPINDPIGAVVWGMDTSNVDRVFVTGRAGMRDGALEVDVERARNLATIAPERVTAAAGLVIGAARGGGG